MNEIDKLLKDLDDKKITVKEFHNQSKIIFAIRRKKRRREMMDLINIINNAKAVVS